MTLRVVGAGLGRTGTASLSTALEMLIGSPSYHMSVLWSRPDDVGVWRRFIERDVDPDWRSLFAGFGATLDWPACAYWEPIAAAHPDAMVLLSTRPNIDEWYASYERTIVPLLLDTDRFRQGAMQVARRVTFDTFTNRVDNAWLTKRAYEMHNAHVRAKVPQRRLIEWQPGDGWGPLCAGLGLPEPSEPFPHVNSADELRDQLRLDDAEASERTPLAGRVKRRIQRSTKGRR